MHQSLAQQVAQHKGDSIGTHSRFISNAWHGRHGQQVLAKHMCVRSPYRLNVHHLQAAGQRGVQAL